MLALAAQKRMVNWQSCEAHRATVYVVHLLIFPLYIYPEQLFDSSYYSDHIRAQKGSKKTEMQVTWASDR